jgi:hypothetical protein
MASFRSRSTGVLSKAKSPCANDKLDTTYSAGQLAAAFGFLWATFGVMTAAAVGMIITS